MSQISHGTITVTDITDIIDVYLQYCMAADTYTTAAAIAAKTTWTSPEVNWFTLTTDTTIINNKRYYILSNGNYYIVTPTGSENPSTNGWYEDSSYPTWQSGYQTWIREVTVKEGIELPEYGTPYLDKAVNQINTNYVNLNNKLKTFFYPGDINHNYSGAFAVSKTENDGLNTANADTYGFNTRVATGLISMGYNKIPLLEMGLFETGTPANGIKLYSPILTNGIITNHRLDATLSTYGLKLLKGGIVAGDYAAGQNGYIYLSTENGPRISINGFTPGTGQNDPQWRAIIGTKFGVTADGTLYASNANISGTITVGSGSNVYNKSEVSSAIENATTGKADNSMAVYREQRIYRRYTSAQSNLSGPTTWITTNSDTYSDWTTKVPQLTNDSTKYPYLYTCIQKQTITQYDNGNGTSCTCTEVLLDDTTTVIDGGNIITGTVTAAAIDATNLHVSSANIDGNLTIGKVTDLQTTLDSKADAESVSELSLLTEKTYYAYASDVNGTDFSTTDTNLKYRGLYVTTDDEQSTEYTDYIWELNVEWARKYADKFLHETSSGMSIYDDIFDSETYAELSAVALSFYLDNVQQMKVGYESTIEDYGVISENHIALGSGAGVKFDNYGHDDAGARGRFVWEIRNNGHLSLKLY